MKNFKEHMNRFTEIVGEDNYIQDGNKILINQTAIDLMRKAINEFKTARTKERDRLRAIKKKESNAITNAKHNPKDNSKNNVARDRLRRVRKFDMAPPVIRCTEAVYCEEDYFIYIEDEVR